MSSILVGNGSSRGTQSKCESIDCVLLYVSFDSLKEYEKDSLQAEEATGSNIDKSNSIPDNIGYNKIKITLRRLFMTRTFIEVPLFSKRWNEIGLGDDELTQLQIILLKDPESGPVMEGTGGIRKVRFAIENRGKSSGVRVCYTDFAEYEVIYLITAFQKNEQENLTDEEKNVLKKLVKSLREEAEKNRR